MPVRLPKSQWNNWLDWNVPADAPLGTMLGSEDLDFYDVGREVGSGRASGADLIRPAN